MMKSNFKRIIFVGGFALSAIIANNANAFSLIKRTPDSAKTSKSTMTPAILMPGETAPVAQSNEQSPKAKPATQTERQNAKALSPAAASVFWINELTINPKDEIAAIEASKALRLNGAADKATEIAAFGIQSNPNSAALWTNLGLGLVAENKFEPAINVLNKAIGLNAKDDSLYNALGIAYDSVENYAESYNAYNKGLMINPNNTDILTNLGLSLALNGKLNEAEATLRKAVSLPFAPVEARQNLALIVGLQGRLAESEKIASQDLPPDVAAKNIIYLKSVLGEQKSK